MFSLFQRKKVSLTLGGSSPPIDMPKGLTRPESATSLLATTRRQRLLEHIWQRTSLSRKQFAALYLAPLERYAELVQQLPASESHHHAYPGGMLDHGLEIVAYALKLRQSHLLPVGATPEAQAAQAEAWTAGTAYAALLHDIGKIAVDLHVEYADGETWHPWHGPLQRPYRFRYRKDREYRLHSAASGLLYARLLDSEALDWLSSYPDLWSALLYVLAGQYEHAGTLGELVTRADQASVAQELGGDPTKAMTAPRHALQRKLLEGLRYLLKEEFKLNQPQASDGWLTQDALWLVSKTVSDKLRAHLLSQGIDGIPSSNIAIFNVLQDHGMLQPNANDKAIWKATVSSASGWSHSFTLLKLSPALIWQASERPAPFAGTVTVEASSVETGDSMLLDTDPAVAENSALPPAFTVPDHRTEPVQGLATGASKTLTASQLVMEDMLSILGPSETASSALANEMSNTGSSATAESDEPIPNQKPGSLPPLAQNHPLQPSGEHFIDWLKQGIVSRKLIINDAKALVHTVADTVYLVSPGVFQRYAQEHPQITPMAKQEKVQEWQWIQKRFEKLQIHRKQGNGQNIWTCDVTRSRKSRRLHGYLLEDALVVFAQVPPNNPYLSLSVDK